jgi:hypothetical protein
LSEVKNPYAEMTSDVITQHLEQLKSVVEEKKIDVTQFFGEPASISPEDQSKIDQHDSLTSQVKTLTEAESAKNLSDNEAKLAQASFDRAVSDIKTIDPSVPLESIVSTKFNNLEKYDIMSGVKPIVEHYQAQIATLRKEIGGSGDAATTQKFAAPEESSDAETLVAEVIASNPGIVKENK